jgi:hypothetical protein
MANTAAADRIVFIPEFAMCVVSVLAEHAGAAATSVSALRQAAAEPEVRQYGQGHQAKEDREAARGPAE